MKKEVYEFVSKKLNDKILERKKCEQCTEDFPIFQKDQELLEKIAPTVGGKKQSFTSPQFCPDCRARQRLVWRNEWNFYSAKSALSGEKLFSLYSPLSNIPVISNDEFFSDAFDAMIYGKDIDMNTSILTQIGELRKKVPTQATMTIDNQNCYYTTGTGYNKNCYLINSSENCEDCMYGKLFQTCKKCMDCSYVYDSEKLYECINVKKGYNCMWLHNSQECSYCYYSDDMIGCQYCMFCSGLRNAKYYFQNKQLTKEEWEAKSENFLGSKNNISAGLEKFQEVEKNKITKYANVVKSENSYGDFQTDNKNCMACYDVNGSEDCRYVTVGVEIKNVVDANNIYLGPEKAYDCLGIMHVQNVHFCIYVFDSHSLILCQECYDNCNNLFGCVGLKKKQYCIFNKQYTQEEYEKLVPQLIQKMKTEKERRFFDPAFAAYPYNDSLAIEYFPIEKVKMGEQGEIKILDPAGQGTVIVLHPEQNISDAILDLGGEYKMSIKRKNVAEEINIPAGIPIVDAKNAEMISDEEILKVAFRCEESGRPYKILKQELDFYKLMKLPIPVFHYDVRYKKRLQQKPTRELHLRKCDKCTTEMVSVYPQDSDFKVYCEVCYNKEIYG